MKSLQTRIFLFFVVLLLIVQAIALWTILSGKQNQEELEIKNRVSTANTIFNELFNNRTYYLKAFADTAAQDYGIKQVFNQDTRSLVVALNNLRQRIDADIAMTIDIDGNINSQLINRLVDGSSKIHKGSQSDTRFKYPQWLNSQSPPTELYQVDEDIYQISLSPIIVGTKVIGWVGFGFQIDNRLAMRYFNLTGLETSFILKKYEANRWYILASSNPNADVGFVWEIVEGLHPEQYISHSEILSTYDDFEFGVAMYSSRADIVAVLQQQWWQLVGLILITLILSLAGAYAIASSVTKPIKQLVKQAKNLASGKYQKVLLSQDQSEMGQLANEFNAMQSAILSREKALEHKGNHHLLTDLPNRNMLLSTLQTKTQSEQSFVVLHLNLSRLKDVNDALGHEFGDRIIIEAGLRLNEIKAFSGIFHTDSDEFILLADQQSQATVEMLISAIESSFSLPLDYQGFNFRLQARIGIAIYPEHSQSSDQLLQMADTALHYTRKKKQLVQVYDASFDVNTIERLNLINDFKHAIEQDHLELHFQPKMDLTTKLITHVEALVRWRHPKLGLIPPDNFIPIAEQTGQITQLTQWVFEAALVQHNQWLKQGIDLNIAINISAQDLRDSNFFDFVCQRTEHFNINPQKITLEVTESAVVEDPKSAIALLNKFKALGYYLSIDDYGTGYSSLAQLKSLPVHELKIDKSFVQRLQHDSDDQIIVRSPIELAHNMGLTLVAEGIEDEFALNWLSEHHCEKAQGYFISRPYPAPQLTTWLLENNNFQRVSQDA